MHAGLAYRDRTSTGVGRHSYQHQVSDAPAFGRNLDSLSGMIVEGTPGYRDFVLPKDLRLQSNVPGLRVDQLQAPWAAREFELTVVVERPLVPPQPGGVLAAGVVQVHGEQ